MGTLTASTSLFDPSTDLFLNGPSVFEDQSGLSIFNYSAGTLPAASRGDSITGAARDYYAFFGAEGSEMYFDMDDIDAANAAEVNALRAFVLGPDGTLLQQIDDGGDAFVDLTDTGIHHVVVTDDAVPYLGNFAFGPVFFIPPIPTNDYRLDIAYSRYSPGNDYAVTEYSATDDFTTVGATGQFSQMLGGDDFGFFQEENDVVSSTGLTGDKTYYGASGNDILQGALTGSDTIYGGSGDDILSSGLDVAIFFPGAGDDVLDGGSGSDLLLSNSGDDELRGSDGSDELYAASGNDTLKGGDDADLLDAGQGDDLLEGGNGNDTLLGGADADRMFGGTGADFLEGGPGADKIDGGSGSGDEASYENSAAGVTVELSGGPGSGGEGEGDTLVNVEDVVGSDFDDELIGDGASNDLFGRDGDDILEGRGGADNIEGGDEDTEGDTLSYEASPTAVTIALFNGTTSGGDAAGDTFTEMENVRGSAFDDVLSGNSVSNIFEGGGGADQLFGGFSADTASYEHSPAGVEVALFSNTATGGDAEGDELFSVERLRGSGFDDVLSGDGGGNRLEGLDGNDEIYGGGQGDILVGGAGEDYLVGGAGNDELDGGADADTFLWGAAGGQDTVLAFEDGIDLVELGGSLTFADLTIAPIGGGTQVSVTATPSATIDLLGVNSGDVTAADFI